MSTEDQEIYERIIWQDEQGHNQIRLVVNCFRGVEYIHLRKYYLDFEEVWCPSDKGISFPLSIETTNELFKGLAEIISLAESREIIEQYFGDVIKEIYNNS
jgi:hypothetical protein